MNQPMPRRKDALSPPRQPEGRERDTSSRTYGLLHHIGEEIDFLRSTAATVDREAFLAHETMRRAFARSVEMIGGGVRALPPDLRDRYPRTDREEIVETGDRLIREYATVDYAALWGIV